MTMKEEQRKQFANFQKDPNHKIDFLTHGKTVRVLWHGHVIAESNRALQLLETGHDPVFYFPRDDVSMNILEPTEHATHCPYKGDANYWTIRIDNNEAVNAVWSYEDPLTEVSEVKDHIAFYYDFMDANFGITLET